MPTSVISPSNLTLNVNITIPSLVPQAFDNSNVTCNHTYNEILKTYAAGGLINCKVTCANIEHPAVFSSQNGAPAFIFQPFNIEVNGKYPTLNSRVTYVLVMYSNSWYLTDIYPNILTVSSVSGQNVLKYTFDQLYNHVLNTQDVVAIQYSSNIYFLSYCDTNVIKFNWVAANNFLTQQSIVFTPQNVTSNNSYVIADVRTYNNMLDTAVFSYAKSQGDTYSYLLSLSDGVKDRLYGTFNNNLLDNWYFVNPVNQRGAATYTGAVFGIDRWRGANANTKITITSYDTSTALPTKDTGLTLQSTDTSVQPFLTQTIKYPEQLLGKTLTLSVLTSENTLFSATAAIPSSISTDNTLLININNVVDLLGMKNGNMYVRLKTANGSTALAYKAVKLEIGYQQTLCHTDDSDNYVLNEIADYSMELLKCQRYLQIIRSPYDAAGNGVAIGYANNTGDLWVSFPLTVPMRIAPTVNIESDGKDYLKIAKSSGGTMKDVTKVTGGWATNVSHACNMRSIIFTTTGLTTGETYTLFMLKGAKLILTSEL